MEPDRAYAFPNEDGLHLVLVAPHRDRLPEFRRNLESAYLRFVAGLPDGPNLAAATVGARRRSPATLFTPRTVARLALRRPAAPTA